MLQLYIQVKVKNTDFPNREGIRGQIPEILAYPNCLVVVWPGVVAARVNKSNNDISFLLQNERISSGETDTERYRD